MKKLLPLALGLVLLALSSLSFARVVLINTALATPDTDPEKRVVYIDSALTTPDTDPGKRVIYVGAAFTTPDTPTE